jgi:hypothetical protein
MRPRTLSLVLVVAVLSAGCIGASGPITDTDATPTPTPGTQPDSMDTGTSTPEPTPTPEPTLTSATEVTPTPTAEPTPTATPGWSEPQPPNEPEAKYDDTNRTRIFDVRVVNEEESANGSGYSDFDLEVDANTSMENVDPASHGSVEGEPYFLVYASDELIYRSDYVEFRNGTFTLEVHPGALDQFEEGSLKLVVFLMDRDSTYDDEYDYETVRIEYSPE